MSSQFNTGGGGGMHTSGYKGLQFPLAGRTSFVIIHVLDSPREMLRLQSGDKC